MILLGRYINYIKYKKEGTNMKRIIAALLAALMLLSLCACGAKKDGDGTTAAPAAADEKKDENKNENENKEENKGDAQDADPVSDSTPAEPASEENKAAEPTELKLNEALTLDNFVTITFTEAGYAKDVSKSIKQGIVTRKFGPSPESGKQFVYLNGKIKNTGKTELPVFDFFNGEFDIDGYKFNCTAGSNCEVYNAESGETYYKLDPLGEYDFFIYQAVAEELADGTKPASFRFGFFDGFANEQLSYNRSFEDDPISLCPYYYLIVIK